MTVARESDNRLLGNLVVADANTGADDFLREVRAVGIQVACRENFLGLAAALALFRLRRAKRQNRCLRADPAQAAADIAALDHHVHELLGAVRVGVRAHAEKSDPVVIVVGTPAGDVAAVYPALEQPQRNLDALIFPGFAKLVRQVVADQDRRGLRAYIAAGLAYRNVFFALRAQQLERLVVRARPARLRRIGGGA